MCYIITDGQYYINSSGGHHVVNNMNQATKMKREKAVNVLKCLPKILRKYSWEVRYANLEYGEIIGIPEVKEIDYSIYDKVVEIENFAKDIKLRYLYLKSKLHEVELEIVDIEHAAEFYNLNASQGYKIYKMLHDSRNERRKIKDEMLKIEYIMDGTMKTALNNKMSQSILGLDNRQYTPRVLKELFNV